MPELEYVRYYFDNAPNHCVQFDGNSFYWIEFECRDEDNGLRWSRHKDLTPKEAVDDIRHCDWIEATFEAVGCRRTPFKRMRADGVVR